ncbi:flavodoxin domain-containing protein [Shimia sp. W99]
MKVLVAYATSEGHTRRIARHVSDRIVDAGHGVELLALGDAQDIHLGRFDRVIFAASLHVGHYQRALADFVGERANDLAGTPSLLLSVSLAAAGHEAEDWRDLARIAEEFEEATGWHPDEVVQVAGAYLPSRYDIVRRLIMRRIIAKKDPDADLDADKVYTDWTALDAQIDAWMRARR